jgi:hypothetical protein
MRTKPPAQKVKLSCEPVTSPPRKKSRTTFGSSVNDLEEDEDEPVQMRLEVREEKRLMQQPCKATLRNNLNPT